jgi:hypothetical protein
VAETKQFSMKAKRGIRPAHSIEPGDVNDSHKPPFLSSPLRPTVRTPHERHVMWPLQAGIGAEQRRSGFAGSRTRVIKDRATRCRGWRMWRGSGMIIASAGPRGPESNLLTIK